MSPRARSKRDFDELERRRIRAAKLLNRGVRQAEVARQVKVSRESVRRWSNQNREARDGGLKEGRARRKTARLERGRTEKVGDPFAGGPREGGIFEWIVDARSDRTTDPPTLSSGVSLRSRVVDSTPEIGLELPASGRPCPRAERGGYPRLEGKYLARS
jgi:Homeodomain-like domain